ncbi:MAG: glycosyltransferase family 4 protein [Acidobacteria bacterium]|nr:glycosyltransferase family 4 protein [Acidobacteriota bacterium]
MRVIHILKHCGYANGNVHVAVDLACVQARSGYDVTVISAGGTFVPLLEQYGVQHVVMPHEQRNPLAILRAAWKLTFMARKTRPIAIHAHMMSSAFVGYIASLLSGVPLITTVHNSFDKHSVIMRLGTRVVAVSKAEYDKLLKRGYNRRALCMVMNAPDQSPRDGFMNDGRVLEVSSPCIVAANGLHRRKGVFDLIDAFATLTTEFPHWNLYIAGEGPDREKLEQQSANLHLQDRVHFLGFLPAPRSLMEKADIYVLASYAEPCGLSIGEARSAGCAIVATDVGGIPEMLEFGRAGRLIKPGRPDQLAAELRTLMSDEPVRNALRAAAKSGSEIFNVQRLLQDYEAIYLEANKPSRTPATVQMRHDEVA